jgi:hypothetical protein
MNRRKMNNYSLTRMSSVLILAAVLIVSTFSFSNGTRADALTNNPPNEPSNPVPTNGSLNVSINANMTWTGGDPDGDITTYDVFFGTINPPVQVATNQSTTLYHPGTMNYSTKYYWKIIAWDSFNASTPGPLWQFTTKQEGQINITFNSPVANSFYFMDVYRFPLKNRTIVYGPITINVSASADSGIERIELFIDGKSIETSNNSSLVKVWRPVIQFSGLSLKRAITVIAYDNEGNNATAELNITKWRFHALPWIVAGVAVASTLVQHTTIRGLVFNLKQTALGLTFFALRLHYKTVGPFQTTKGVTNFKHCKIGVLIGPMKRIQLGKFTWISCSSLGKINFNNPSFSQGISRLFQQKNKLKS